jgi:hypothetical protein
VATVIHARLVKRGYYTSSSGHVYKGDDVNLTLCGAPMTDMDILVKDAGRFKDTAEWQLCPACRAAVERKQHNG